MKTDHSPRRHPFWINLRLLWLLCSCAEPLSAGQFGLFTYLVEDDMVTITSYPRDAVGDVEIPAEIDGQAVTSIGDGAFWSCSSLKSISIPDGVTTIGNEAFFSCISATTITIPDSVTTIGEGAFLECWELPSITIPNSVTTIGEGAFVGCINLTRIDIPSSVTTISEGMFSKCGRLKSVTIPNSVTTIGSYAFGECNSLTSVTIPESVTTIGGGAFAGCSSLASIIIPNSVTRIAGQVLSGCSSLKSVTIPDSVTTIGGAAFFGCDSLKSVTIPGSVTTIGDRPFGECKSLISIMVASGNRRYASEDGVLFNLPKTTLIHYPGGKTGTYSIPDSVTKIGDYAFAQCVRMTGVIIPENVTSIGSRAFFDCTSLTSVTIPSSVKEIYPGVFQGCYSLTTAIFLGDVTLYAGSFRDTAHDFTIYYISSSTVSNSPGYPEIMIDEDVYPAASWLLQYELPYDTYINDDGSLIMAYALDLAPNCVPRINPAFDPESGALNLTFHAASPGITYIVETSTDLHTWHTEGVTLSVLGPDNTMTATVIRKGPRQFMRLVVIAKA